MQKIFDELTNNLINAGLVDENQKDAMVLTLKIMSSIVALFLLSTVIFGFFNTIFTIFGLIFMILAASVILGAVILIIGVIGLAVFELVKFFSK